MGDIAVESQANHVPPHKKAAPSAIPTLDSFEGLPLEGGDDYASLKKLQRQLEYVQLQEEYIKDEQRYGARQAPRINPRYGNVNAAMNRSLKRELVRAQEEIKRIQSVPLVIGQFMEAIDQKYVPRIRAKLCICKPVLTSSSVPVLCSQVPDQTTSSASSRRLTANSSSRHLPSLSIDTPMRSSTSFLPRPTRLLPCSARTKSLMSHMPTLVA